jgi:Ca2+-binding EF-hand superfamily protein
MKRVLIPILALAAGLLLVLPAAAQGPGNKAFPTREIFKQADKNGDGKVTFEELQALRPNVSRAQFDRLDRNKDGVLSKADVPRNPARILANLIKKVDKDGDGKVTFEELKAVAPKMTQERFNQLDTNHDGVLSQEDRPLAANPQDRPEQRRRFLMGLRQADANGDGKVTFEEAQPAFPKMTRERFNTLDRNGDGVISKDDRRPNA